MRENATTFATIRPPSAYPSSHKQYIHGSRVDLRVPDREISLWPTNHSNRLEENPPLSVYDTSAPYTDPEENRAKYSSDEQQGMAEKAREFLEQGGRFTCEAP